MSEPSEAGLTHLNAASDEAARKLLASCCGATRWIEEMIAARPFASRAALHAAAERSWRACGKDDLFEAMRHHPRIGERKDVPPREAAEQAGAARADERIKAAIAEGNREYEARFGHIYLVCASGKSGEELLAILRARLANDPQAELAVAAAEQGKITTLRLDKLLDKGNA
jgi:2-oxo-4-hydroxy-4-carboxy-5-ureidoimidazoline decarboxylase